MSLAKRRGEAVREEVLHEHSADLRLLPKDYHAFPQSICNTKTGEVMPMSLQAVRVSFDKVPDESGSWLEGALGTLMVVLLFVVGIGGMLAKRKMTLSELADEVGITVSNMSIFKTGKVRAIRISTLDTICRVLDCSVGDILEYRADEATDISSSLPR